MSQPGQPASPADLPGWTSYPRKRLPRNDYGDDAALPEGQGAVVVDCWQPRPHPQNFSSAPVILVDGDIASEAWGRVHVTVPAGVHTVLAAESEPFSCARLMVTAGEVVHLDFVQAYTTSRSGRLVPPGTRPSGRFLVLHFWLFMISVPTALLVLDRFPVPFARAFLIAVVAALGVVGAVVLRPRGVWHRFRPPRVRSWAEQTRRAAADGASDPSGSRFLGDRPPNSGPRPPPGRGAVQLQARWSMTPGVFSISHQKPFRNLARVLDRHLRVRINNQPVPGDWSTWWYPVDAGRVRISVEHPVPAELDLDVAAGEVVAVFYWAHLLEDRLLAFAVVPEMSSALLTTTRVRRGDEPALPGRQKGALFTDDQLRALRKGRRSRPPRQL